MVLQILQELRVELCIKFYFFLFRCISSLFFLLWRPRASPSRLKLAEVEVEVVVVVSLERNSAELNARDFQDFATCRPKTSAPRKTPAILMKAILPVQMRSLPTRKAADPRDVATASATARRSWWPLKDWQASTWHSAETATAQTCSTSLALRWACCNHFKPLLH